MVFTKPENRNASHFLFVIFVSSAFWIWLAKDFILEILPLPIPGSKLLMIVAVVLALLGITEILPKKYKPNDSNGVQVNTFVYIAIFCCYCLFSAYITGIGGFTLFKLVSLSISVIIAIALAGKMIQAIFINKQLFFCIGLIIGLLGYCFVYYDLSDYSSGVGLRVRKMAHLNVQDFYIILFIYSGILLFGGKFRKIHLIFFLGTSLLCMPIIIALNSRMVPFTLGITLIYFCYSARSIILAPGNRAKYAVIFTLFLVCSIPILKDKVSSAERMIRIFRDGGISDAASSRTSLYWQAVDDFSESPLYGIGFARYKSPGYHHDPANWTWGFWPHNIFLEILAELGILGFLLIAIPIGDMVRKMFYCRIKENSDYLIFPYLILVYTLCTMQFTHNIWHPILWIGIFSSSAAYTKYRHTFYPNKLYGKRYLVLPAAASLSLADEYQAARVL